MSGDGASIDHYKILKVRQNCSAKALETAYRRLAKMYHPDHADTADVTKFNEVIAAYRALRNPKRRAEYDASIGYDNDEDGDFSSNNDAANGNAAADDADDHAIILMELYKRRREDAQNPGVVPFYLLELLNCSHEHFEFHKWYLKEKGFIAITEQGTLAITIQGVDHVISTSRAARAETLLIAQSNED
jgi:curved DNA-binding protein